MSTVPIETNITSTTDGVSLVDNEQKRNYAEARAYAYSEVTISAQTTTKKRKQQNGNEDDKNKKTKKKRNFPRRNNLPEVKLAAVDIIPFCVSNTIIAGEYFKIKDKMNKYIEFHKMSNDTQLCKLLYNKSPEEVEDLRSTMVGMTSVWNDLINIAIGHGDVIAANADNNNDNNTRNGNVDAVDAIADANSDVVVDDENVIVGDVTNVDKDEKLMKQKQGYTIICKRLL